MIIKEYFSDPKHWCQGKYASFSGNKIYAMCLSGAIMMKYREDDWRKIFDCTATHIKENYGYDSIVKFNDAVNYDTVMEVVERLNL